MSDQDRFAERLIAAEQVDAKRKEQHQMQMSELLTPTVSRGKRIVYGLIALVGLFYAINSASLAIGLDVKGEYAGWGRAVFGVAAAFGLLWAVLAGKIAITGRVDRRRDLAALAKLLWYFSFFIAVVALSIAALGLKYDPGSPGKSIFAAVVGVVFLVLGTLHVTRNLVQQSELRVREKLLEIELKLVEISEELRKRQG